MSRIARITVPGVPHHVTQRGNRRREQIKAGVFQIRLKPEDWTSGDEKRSLAWLLDVIAPTQKLASAVLANFRQVVKEGDMRIHPIVARMFDPEHLKKMTSVS